MSDHHRRAVTTRQRKSRDTPAPRTPRAPAAPQPKGAPVSPRDRAFRRDRDASPEIEAAPVAPKEEKREPVVDQDALAQLMQMGSDDFAQAMSELMSAGRQTLEVGGRVSGQVVRVGERDVFVDLGGKSEGSISRDELLDGNGELSVVPGQVLDAYVVRVSEGEVRLSRRLSGDSARQHLEEAKETGAPVEGKVLSRNGGGFMIEVGGVRAFCPVSQIDRPPVADPDSYVGRTLLFKVKDGKEGDMLLSHRALREAEAAEQAVRTWKELRSGQERDGVVRSIQDYGVFVDVGGVEGLVHVSRMGLAREADLREAFSVGQSVQVKVLDVDVGAQRVSLSIRDHSAFDGTSSPAAGGGLKSKPKKTASLGTFAELFAQANKG